MNRIQRMCREIAMGVGTPTFMYSETVLRKNAARIQNGILDSGLRDRVRIYVSYFANSNPHLHKILLSEGLGLTVQSREEVEQLAQFGISLDAVIASPGVLSDGDLQYFVNKGIPLNLTHFEEVSSALPSTSNLGVRLDLSPEQNQRTGFKINEFPELHSLIKRSENSIHSIHTYPGTGSSLNDLLAHAEEVFSFHQKYFSNVRNINLGGGFAFEYEEAGIEEKHFPWNHYFSEIKELLGKYQISSNVKIAIEPGRDIFADAGSLLLGINRTHQPKNTRVTNVYTDGSYTYMPSATVCGRQHDVYFLDGNYEPLGNREGFIQISGSTTLSSDYVFPGIVRAPNNLEKGNFILIADIGAYGATQHMEFLNKRPTAEVLVTENNSLQIISERGNYTDKTRYVPLTPKEVS